MNPEETDKFQRFEQLLSRLTAKVSKREADDLGTAKVPEAEPSDKPLDEDQNDD